MSTLNLKEIFNLLNLNKNQDKEDMSSDKNQTYSLNIITKWLKKNNLNYEYNSSRAGSSNGILLYHHGVTLILNNLKVSIQTHPIVAGWSFAETLITNDMTSDIRHETPEKLFEYLNQIILEDKSFINKEESLIEKQDDITNEDK